MDAMKFSLRSTTWRMGAVVMALQTIMGCRTASETDIANGDDPMRALEVNVLSNRYTSTFWQTQSERNPDLWRRAVAYCEPQRSAPSGAKPNCGSVFNAQFEIAGRKPPVPRRRRDVGEQVFTP